MRARPLVLDNPTKHAPGIVTTRSQRILFFRFSPEVLYVLSNARICRFNRLPMLTGNTPVYVQRRKRTDRYVC